MARNRYSGEKRRREIEKKKKREEKLARKQHHEDKPEGEIAQEEDTSYLEYLYPGGVPEELLPKKDDEGDETDETAENEKDDEQAPTS
jgi:hypothetical protein